MATIEKFEDLEVWKKARMLSKEIYLISSKGNFAKDFDLKNQARRSSGSVMDNIAEGFERGGKGEFIQFLGIAKGSNGELRSQLYRALDNDYITKTEFENLYQKSDEISKMINGLIAYLNRTDIKGSKYKK
ncbi:MAG: four helix bundle protein [Bacteroidales bacterium]